MMIHHHKISWYQSIKDYFEIIRHAGISQIEQINTQAISNTMKQQQRQQQ